MFSNSWDHHHAAERRYVHMYREPNLVLSSLWSEGEIEPGNELFVDLIGGLRGRGEGGGVGVEESFLRSSTVLYGFFAYVSTND